MSRESQHWDFIPKEVVDALQVSDAAIKVDIYGDLARAIRKEAKETGETDSDIVHKYLLEYLADKNLPKKVPANRHPVTVTVSGPLASLLRANAESRGLSPQDSAIEILCAVFEVAHPRFRKNGNKQTGKPIPKGLAFTVLVPGVVAQAIRRANYGKSVTGSFIASILRGYFRDPNDQPVIPGMEVCS
jgi:hypothetical protein